MAGPGRAAATSAEKLPFDQQRRVNPSSGIPGAAVRVEAGGGGRRRAEAGVRGGDIEPRLNLQPRGLS